MSWVWPRTGWGWGETESICSKSKQEITSIYSKEKSPSEKHFWGEDRIPVVSSRFQDRWKSSGFGSSQSKSLYCAQMCPHCIILNYKEEITVRILGVRRAVVNSVVLWLQVLSDSFESPSGTLEVYRQTNRYSWNGKPCEACCTLSHQTQSEFLMWLGYKSLLQPMTENPHPLIWGSDIKETWYINVLLGQPVTWENH